MYLNNAARKVIVPEIEPLETFLTGEEWRKARLAEVMARHNPDPRVGLSHMLPERPRTNNPMPDMPEPRESTEERRSLDEERASTQQKVDEARTR